MPLPVDPGGVSGAVCEISFTSGTGTYTLSGPAAGGVQTSFFRFADFYADGDHIPSYRVTDTSYTEICSGVYSANTLTRDALIKSTTGAFIDWPVTGQRQVTPIILLQGLVLCPTMPTNGQVLVWDAVNMWWCPMTLIR